MRRVRRADWRLPARAAEYQRVRVWRWTWSPSWRPYQFCRPRPPSRRWASPPCCQPGVRAVPCPAFLPRGFLQVPLSVKTGQTKGKLTLLLGAFYVSLWLSWKPRLCHKDTAKGRKYHSGDFQWDWGSESFDIFRQSHSREFPTDKSQLVKSKVSCHEQTGKTKKPEEASVSKTDFLLPKSEIVPIKLKNSYKWI